MESLEAEQDKSLLTYIYLSSAPHSGSTLIACLLGAHPAISTVGEFGAPVKPTQRCSCGETYQTCSYWQQWVRCAASHDIDMQFEKLGINLEPHIEDGFIGSFFYYLFPWKFLDTCRDISFRLLPAWHQSAALSARKAVDLVKILCSAEKTSVFLDTMKNPLQVRFLNQHPGIRCKLIALIRDGRGVMNSLITREKFSPEQSVDTWLWANRNMARVARYLPLDDVFWLKLEDLCQQPQKVLHSLFTFCNADPSKQLDYTDIQHRHIIGNSMRLHFTGEIKHDEKWRDILSREHLQLFAKKAGWLNRRFGYDD